MNDILDRIQKYNRELPQHARKHVQAIDTITGKLVIWHPAHIYDMYLKLSGLTQ